MSYMFHFPNLKWTRLQAEATALPQVTGETPGVKEEELADLSRTIRKAKETHRIEGICTGALASLYQKTRVEKVCKDLDLECISPLWGVDPADHLRRLVDEGFVVTVVSVSALGLGEEWLGRTLDSKAIDELVDLGRKHRFHVGFEGGEGETFVLDAPFFARRIRILASEKHWRGDSGYLEIKDARLVAKVRRKEREA